MIITYLWTVGLLVPIAVHAINFPGLKNYDYCIEPPAKCPNQNITFHLYTRYADDYVFDMTNDETFYEAPFVLRAPIKFLIHGYTGHKDYSPNTELRPAYRRYMDLNVISVDYKKLVRENCYTQAVHNVPLVGKCTKMFLVRLFRLRPDLRLDDLHVVGFSLGAQVAGHVGRLMNHTIGRITGLDPASPLFNKYFASNEVLDKSDALFVDVIHTNIAFKGKISPLGHVDFYANNGVFQPGCGTNTSCSHVRAVEYFAESINAATEFYAVKCLSYFLYKWSLCNKYNTSSLIVVGEHVDTTQKGIYYFMTNSSSPYALGLDPHTEGTSVTSTVPPDSFPINRNDVSSN